MFAIDRIRQEVDSDEKEAIESPEQKGGTRNSNQRRSVQNSLSGEDLIA
jgi:hypothetical protein